MYVADPVSATIIIAGVLCIAALFTVRTRRETGLTPDATQEAKGFAILAIVFSHIGYFLADDHRFLFPLSTIAGPGVDIFLLLSGFGLAMSAFGKPRSVAHFYLRRLDKLLVPLWIALALLFSLAYVVQGETFSSGYILRSFLAWFPSADIYHDLDSPLWYITLIIPYYVIFPLAFSTKRPLISAGLLFAVGYALHYLALPFMPDVAHLHALHLWAFPIGVALAAFVQRGNIPAVPHPLARTAVLVLASIATGYLALHQTISGELAAEQGISIITALLVLSVFSLKRFHIAALSMFGLYSYEIYLFHWPILYRYGYLFSTMPAWLALFIYLAIFVAIGWLIQRLMHMRART